MIIMDAVFYHMTDHQTTIWLATYKVSPSNTTHRLSPNHCCMVTIKRNISNRRAPPGQAQGSKVGEESAWIIRARVHSTHVVEGWPQGTRGPPDTARAPLHRSIACLLVFQGNKNAMILRVCTLLDTVSFRPWAMTIWTVHCNTTLVPNLTQIFSVSSYLYKFY